MGGRSLLSTISGAFLTNAAESSDMQLERIETAPWMRHVLRAAGVYNLIWGGIAILFPLAMFRWTSFEELPRYPELWQCLGMVIGVYGIGYWIAARAPLTHWPIVFVGLLGKVFGPIGFISAALSGDLPWSMGWIILLNDLIWWVPFGVILWRALLHHQLVDSHSGAPREIGDPVHEITSQLGQSLAEISNSQPVLLVFLRHSGCTFCREALSDLNEQRAEIEAAGVRIAVVHMDTEENAQRLVSDYSLQDIHCFRDPGQYLYRHFQLRLGNMSQLLGPVIWWKGFQAAILRKHGIGPIGGNGFRMPGAFIVHNGKTLVEFRHKTAADRPDYRELACRLDRSEPRGTAVGTGA